MLSLLLPLLLSACKGYPRRACHQSSPPFPPPQGIEEANFEFPLFTKQQARVEVPHTQHGLAHSLFFSLSRLPRGHTRAPRPWNG